jgi:hypothetical protein
MEKTIIQFIVENIFLFLPVGILGIVITVILIFRSKKENIPEFDDLTADYKTIGKYSVNLYTLVYLFIWISIIIIGLFSNSNFIIPTITGGIIAAIPLILLILIQRKNKNSKVL